MTDGLREGIAAARAGDFERAQALLQPVAEASPDDAVPWFWLALASPSAEAAIPHLRHVLHIDGQHGPARAALARLLVIEATAAVAAGRRPEARAFAREAVDLAPKAGVAWLTLASATNDRAERLDALRRAFEASPGPRTRERLRQALLYQAVIVGESDRPAATALLREAAALDPADMHVWRAIAQTAETSADAVEVVREMTRAALGDHRARPLVASAVADQARAFAAVGQAAEACACWREATTLDDRSSDAWLGLAETTDNDEEKKRAIMRAFEIDAKGPDAAGAAEPAEEPDVRDLDLGPEPAFPAATLAPPVPGPTGFESPADAPADLASIEPGPDAFARFESGVDVAALLDSLPDPFADFEFLADPFARFAAVPDAFTAPWPPHPAPAKATTDHLPTPAATGRQPGIPAPSAAVPSHPSPTVPPPAGAGSRSDSGRNPHSARRTVMVVDDSPTMRKVLGLTLERAGYKVVAEPDGESALERLAHLLPDAVLLDASMPRLDGYAVCSRMRHDPRTARIPVVLLSDEQAVIDEAKGRRSGATGYLKKPFESPEVLAVLSDALA